MKMNTLIDFEGIEKDKKMLRTLKIIEMRNLFIQ